ncbi:pentapeptide repeat-containing protein [Nodosilinea sp. FACHB-13]|nr:pentapeptide repeat-containing protein [Nodosilinea sp. FACHB-13]
MLKPTSTGLTSPPVCCTRSNLNSAVLINTILLRAILEETEITRADFSRQFWMLPSPVALLDGGSSKFQN